jgi:hypothetical protein
VFTVKQTALKVLSMSPINVLETEDLTDAILREWIEKFCSTMTSKNIATAVEDIMDMAQDKKDLKPDDGAEEYEVLYFYGKHYLPYQKKCLRNVT